MAGAPASAASAVLVHSVDMPADIPTVRGYDFNKGVDYAQLMSSYARTGFQATSLGEAIEEIRRMRAWRLSDEPVPDDEVAEKKDPEYRKSVKCRIFLAYTSNLVSSGLRETIRYLVQHRMVDVLVTTAGGIEEDFIKCLAPTFLGDFALDGADLRRKGLNRIGNLLVPNDNYCKFEDWITPVLDNMLARQKTEPVVWSPSSFIREMGRHIGETHPVACEDSIYYWAHRNNIPVFCPAITDGSIGDMVFFHSFRNPGLVLDIVQDIRSINELAMHAPKTGMIILGGGVVKHHTCNANLMRNGADFAVYVNTGQEFDGSDSGARPDEAVSWGKIRPGARAVKVYADATLVFPLIVAATFAAEA